MDGSLPPARRRRALHRADPVRFTAALARHIIAEVATGRSLQAICAAPGMPAPTSVSRWSRERGAFRGRLYEARVAAGSAFGATPTYCEDTARSFFERLCEGESILAICRDPRMPCFSTFYRWRRVYPEFAERMRLAREIQAERFCALGWEIAEAVTPETAFATHVKLTHLRWTAGVLSPGKYRIRPAAPRLADEALDAAAEEEEGEEEKDSAPRAFPIRRFRIEQRLSDGAARIVAFTPDPETGELRRAAQDPPWQPAPGAKWLTGAEYADQCRAAHTAEKPET